MAEKLVRLAARVPGLDPFERTVLVYLADRAGRISGQCEVPVPEIAAHCGMSNRHLYRVLRALRDKQLVSVAGKSYADINIYRVNLDT